MWQKAVGILLIVGLLIALGVSMIAVRREYIERYNDVGSTVLKSGTLLQLKENEVYSNPDQVVGTIDRPGTWVIRVN